MKFRNFSCVLPIELSSFGNDNNISVQTIELEDNTGVRFLNFKKFCYLGSAVLLIIGVVCIVYSSLVNHASRVQQYDNSSQKQNYELNINLSIDPCENFYEFACSNWVLNNTPTYSSISEKLHHGTTKFVEDILRASSKSMTEEYSKSAFGKASQLYQKCVKSACDKDEDKKINMNVIWKTLEDFGGWPLFYEPGSWNVSRFSLAKILAGLQNIFPSSRLLDITVKKGLIIQIKASDLFFSSKKSVAEEFTTVAQEFLEFKNVPNMTKVLKDGVDEYLQSYFAINNNNSIRLNYNMSRMDNLLDFPTTTIREFQEKMDNHVLPSANRFDLLDYLHTVFENTGITVSYLDEIQVENITQTLQLVKVISELEIEKLSNYLHFDMASQLVALATENEFTSEAYCAQITYEHFPLVFGQAYVQSKSPSYWNKIREIFEGVKRGYQDLILSSKLPHLNTTLMLNDLDGINFSTGCSNWTLGAQELDKQHEEKMALNAWKRNNNLKTLHTHIDVVEVRPASCIQQSLHIRAFFDQRRVYINLGRLQEDFFSLNFSNAMNYGKLGSIMGHEIGHGLAPSGLFSESSFSQLTRSFVLKNFDLTPAAKCLKEQYSRSISSIVHKSQINKEGEQTLEEVIADNAGLLAAYKAYKMSTSTSGKIPENISNVSKDTQGRYTDEQLFFLGFAQNWCGSSLDTTSQFGVHPPNMLRVLDTLKNSRQFTEAWNCPIGSGMNPDPSEHKKCELF